MCFRIVSISANIPTKQKAIKKICTRHFAKYKCSSNMLTCMQCSSVSQSLPFPPAAMPPACLVVININIAPDFAIVFHCQQRRRRRHRLRLNYALAKQLLIPTQKKEEAGTNSACRRRRLRLGHRRRRLLLSAFLHASLPV